MSEYDSSMSLMLENPMKQAQPTVYSYMDPRYMHAVDKLVSIINGLLLLMLVWVMVYCTNNDNHGIGSLGL